VARVSKPSPFEALTRQQLIDSLEKEVWASAVPHIAQHLANQLMATMGINPKGIDLVMWVSDARHQTNATALADWIGRQMGDPAFQQETRQAAPLAVMARMITNHLESAEAANS
jgi:hypothetical protein